MLRNEGADMKTILASNQIPPTLASTSLYEAESSNQPLRLLSRDNLRALGIDYSNVHMLRLENDGKFPRRIYLSPARVAWVESEVLTHLARCLAARG
jgi:predicted DNA-binding transcriptional regulator AlpA